jgi:RHS repeat-associated protein
MNHAGHLRFSLTHVHKKNHPFCVYEQNCCESKTCDSLGVKPAELTASQILQADSTDYLLGGSLTMKNGRIDKYLFDGGYAQATATGSNNDSFAFYYYNQDHLGNIREVVDASGTVQQVTNYYPFGTPYFDASSTKNADMQPYKYNGKELDRMHGLDTYDYGARQYDPILARWDRIDPLCEKYYDVSPYAYCANNPVNAIDPDGREIFIPKQFQSQILSMINSFSETQYKVNEKGYMCVDKDAKINEKGSNHYSERIDATIAAKGKLTLMVSDKYTLPNGKTCDVEKDYGGGLTITEKTKKSDVKTVVTGKDHLVHDTNGNETKKPAGEVLIHEIVGHAAPAIVGTETGNAVKNENIVRKELGLPERIVNNRHYE